MSEWIEDRWVAKCRKSYTCEFCGDEITKGSPLIDRVYRYLRRACHAKIHNKCQNLYNIIYEFSDLYEDFDKSDFANATNEVWRYFICYNCHNREECECNCWDDGPCGWDSLSTKEQVDKLYNILKGCHLSFNNDDGCWKWSIVREYNDVPITFKVEVHKDV